ncbi:MAG: VWA domain-containing protein [Saprospiraceae bacterium]|nr:VWA domain-containing protein [Saprospiraceae bacterium]
MFRFENINYLFLLFSVVPLLLIIWYFYKTNLKLMRKTADPELMQLMIPGFKKRSGLIKNIIIILLLIISIIALANPQWSNKRTKVKAQSSDIIIALDISQSMFSSDISPSRLEKTKKVIEELILKLKGNRIGLIFFAGEAFMKMPLSPDYAASVMFIKSASPYMIENQGTAIEESIKIAGNAIAKDDKNQKALIIFSDGEDHDGNAVEAAKNADGFTIFTVGVGTEEGGFIPYINQFGVENFKKDDEGKFVRTKVNNSLLEEIAENGKGYFFDITDKSLVKNIAEKLKKIEKREIIQRSFTDYNSQYEYFIFIVILLLILYLLFPEINRKKTSV